MSIEFLNSVLDIFGSHKQQQQQQQQATTTTTNKQTCILTNFGTNYWQKVKAKQTESLQILSYAGGGGASGDLASIQIWFLWAA